MQYIRSKSSPICKVVTVFEELIDARLNSRASKSESSQFLGIAIRCTALYTKSKLISSPFADPYHHHAELSRSTNSFVKANWNAVRAKSLSDQVFAEAARKGLTVVNDGFCRLSTMASSKFLVLMRGKLCRRQHVSRRQWAWKRQQMYP